MADYVQIDTVSTPEEIAAAKAEGWVDGDAYEGREGRPWVPAKEFLAKGKGILPLVQKKAERLEAENAELRGRIEAAESASRAQAAAIDALQAAHDEDTKAQVEAARAELKTAYAQAAEAGDHKAMAELTGQMVDLKDAEKAAAAKKGNGADTAQQQGKAPALHPEVKSWFDAHGDFLANPRKVALSNIIAAEMRAAGDKRGMKQEKGQMAEFLDDVMQKTETELSGGQRRGRDGKVESSSGGGSRGTGDEKTYADLPADAKAACDKAAARIVGPNKLHKTMDSWRKSYVKQYQW